MTYKDAIRTLEILREYGELNEKERRAIALAVKRLKSSIKTTEKQLPCICGRKRLSKWWNYVLGTWSMSCPNCGRTSDHVEHKKDLNKVWNQMIRKEKENGNDVD